MGHNSPPILSPYEERMRHRSMAMVAQVVRKIVNGTYTFSRSICFCGSEKEIEVSTVDRYSMPHRMVICEDCALIRSNPRMTEDSYEKFYNDEYRFINHMVSSGNPKKPLRDEWDAIALHWALGQHKGTQALRAFRDQGQTFPKTLIDFGCHYGGMTSIYREAGIQCYGVEWDLEAKKIAESMGLEVYRTLDELIDKGIQADLIIMQDVIEHMVELRSSIETVLKLLAPKGILYVWTPGLFGETQELRTLFQLAHTFQFCGQTLDYVLNSMNLEPIYLDESICSLWRRKEGMEFNLHPKKPVEWVTHSLDQLSEKKLRVLPPFRGVCKFTRKDRYENVRLNCAKGIPDIREITDTFSGPLMVVSGGPSIDDQVDVMKKMHVEGMPVMAIARMYPWCVENGLGPDFIVSMDAMEEQEKGFEKINPKTIHLMCSVTRPSLFNDLPKGQSYIWDNMDEPKIRDIRREAGYKVATAVHGGSTVTVSTLSLGMNLGFSEFHVFGADCMFSLKEQTHAKGIAGENVKSIEEEVTVCDVKYKSSASFVMFAQHILNMVWAGYRSGMLTDIKFYGESLINKMWDGKFLTAEEAEAREKESEQ